MRADFWAYDAGPYPSPSAVASANSGPGSDVGPCRSNLCYQTVSVGDVIERTQAHVRYSVTGTIIQPTCLSLTNYVCDRQRISDMSPNGGVNPGSIVCTRSPNEPELELTGQKLVRPKKMAEPGKPDHVSLTAKLTLNGQPIPGSEITFSTRAVQGSGGHPLHSSTNPRPKGTLSLTKGNTNASGELTTTFKPPVHAGVYVVKAVATAYGLEEEYTVQAKLDGLVPFPSDTDFPRRWTFIGADGWHGDRRFYLTTSAGVKLQGYIDVLEAQNWGVVGLNDASLIWGGKFPAYPYSDLSQPAPAYPWAESGPHSEHRWGANVDIRTNDVTAATVQKAYDETCKLINGELRWGTLWHYQAAPHFHVYLLGSGTPGGRRNDCWRSAS